MRAAPFVGWKKLFGQLIWLGGHIKIGRI